MRFANSTEEPKGEKADHDLEEGSHQLERRHTVGGGDDSN
jgi:hypothetical protein